MALFGTIATVRAQAPHNAVFDVAWRYVDELLDPQSAVHRRISALSRGEAQKHELSAGVFAIEQVYDTKLRSDVFFESHRSYIDIQVVVAGYERMDVMDLVRATERQPYQPERDFIMYADAADASHLRVSAGEAAIFYPSDVHMPSLRVDGTPVLVRKSVLKLPVGGGR